MIDRTTLPPDLQAYVRGLEADAARLDCLALALGYVIFADMDPSLYAHTTSTLPDDWRNAIDAAISATAKGEG